MEILNRILGEIKITFLHFKERSKNKYYGDRFEEWVVKSSNISKDGSNNSNFWKLLEWRGDKYIEGYRPLSSSSPDLLMECISDKSVFYTSQERIAVECKWRSKKNFFLDEKCIIKYEDYISSNEHTPQNIYFMYLVLDGLVITLKLYMSFLLRNCITTAKKNIKLNLISEKKMWIGSSFLTTTNTKIQVNTLFINLLPNNQIYDTNVGLYFEKTLI